MASREQPTLTTKNVLSIMTQLTVVERVKQEWLKTFLMLLPRHLVNITNFQRWTSQERPTSILTLNSQDRRMKERAFIFRVKTLTFKNHRR